MFYYLDLLFLHLIKIMQKQETYICLFFAVLEFQFVRDLSHILSERRKKASGWEKNLLYPMVMLILLAGTVGVF